MEERSIGYVVDYRIDATMNAEEEWEEGVVAGGEVVGTTMSPSPTYHPRRFHRTIGPIDDTSSLGYASRIRNRDTDASSCRT